MVPSRYFMSSSGSNNNDTTNDNVGPFNSSPPSSPPPPPSDFIPPPPPDPLVNMMTRPGGSSTTEKTVNLPILGEVPDDDSLPVIIGSMAFGALGILLSIVVAFNSREEVFAKLSAVNPPPPKAVRVDDGRCRGICSDQEGSLKDLGQLMESLRRTE